LSTIRRQSIIARLPQSSNSIKNDNLKPFRSKAPCWFKTSLKSNVITNFRVRQVRRCPASDARAKHQVAVVEKGNEHERLGPLVDLTNDILKTIVAEEGDIDLINVYDICTQPSL